MCSRAAWTLRIITRRTPLRTKSERTSRTKALSASTETLTVPGYGRVVVQTPYGIGGAGRRRVWRATSPTNGGGRIAAAGRGGRRPGRSNEPSRRRPNGAYFPLRADSAHG